MPHNNNLFYNAAIEGYVAGSMKGRVLAGGDPIAPLVNSGTPPAIGTTPDPSFAAIALQAETWAGALDLAIPTDDGSPSQPAGTIPTGTVSTGVAIIPSTDATGETQFAQLAKARLIALASLGIFSDRYDAQPPQDFDIVDGTPEAIVYTKRAAKLAAFYDEFALSVIAGASANNLILSFGCAWGGFAALLSGSPISPPIDTTTVEAFAFAGALAVAVDLLIPFDATITINPSTPSTGFPLAPTGTPSGPQQRQLAKMRLMESVTLAYLENRDTFGLSAQNQMDFSTAIAAFAAANKQVIVNAYTGLLAGLDLSTTSTGNNPTLYNEAYCGFVAAALAARPFGYGTTVIVDGVVTTVPPFPLPSSDPFYAAIAAAGVAFALEVDTTVGGIDSTAAGTIPTGSGTQPITVTTGGTQGVVSPTSGALQTAQLGKTGLMWGLCRAVQWGRPLVGNIDDTTPSTYSATAESLVAAYLQLCTALTLT
jgi:hypothetical protein